MRWRKKTPRGWAVRWISSAGRCSAKGRLWAWRKSWRMAKAGRRGTRALDWLIEDLLCSRRTDYRHDSAGGLLPKDRYGKDLRLIQCHSPYPWDTPTLGKRTFSYLSTHPRWTASRRLRINSIGCLISEKGVYE